jgi:hypothetical protein
MPKPSPSEGAGAQAPVAPDPMVDPDALDFSQPLAPQFGIEAVPRRMASLRAKDLGNMPISFNPVSLARVRCLEDEPLA